MIVSTPIEPARYFSRRYAEGLAPVIIVWLVLVGWLASLLVDRANWSEDSDEAIVREWLDEARNFRKTLPELVREYVRQRDDPAPPTADRLNEMRSEIEEHMRGLAEPTRAYLNQLPGFPVIYQLEVAFADGTPPIRWESPLPRPRQQNQTYVRNLESRPLGDADHRAVIRCVYQLHAFNKLQRREGERRRVSLVAAAVLVAATLLAGLFVVQFIRRERAREVQRLTALAEAEHHQRELAESERDKKELDRRLLEQRLEAADLEKRASEAEKTALEMKSQLFASIGIMAASYAHNIKNLLVRPNARLDEVLEIEGPAGRGDRLREVKADLRTVTERLERILATVRRDPSKSAITRVDLAQLVRDAATTWAGMAADKWKLAMTVTAAGPVWVRGDLSHLQQAVENLLFNARDATFEMRNRLRDDARTPGADPETVRRRLIDAAGWKGEVALAVRSEHGATILEVRDNGIGMTAEVRENCTRPHFTTKRNNALLEGHSAGMGLGLAFVAVVLDHHGATLEIESEPRAGALFRVRFPASES